VFKLITVVFIIARLSAALYIISVSFLFGMLF